ncbi:MAG: LpqB family beta-propeller domain-containing protein [Actinomycetes bacterium]
MRTRTRRTLLACVASGLLCACATIPTSGPIKAGVAVGAGSGAQAIRVIAAPPRAGMTPTEIVQGFLVASASFSDQAATAREYLTPARASSWHPGIGVQVFAQDGLQLAATDSDVSAHGQLVATIGPTGEYRLAAAPISKSIPFALTRVAGQWRISSVPDGLLLSEFDVARAFRSYDVYYFDPKFQVLVPDPLTLPVLGSAAATQVVQNLLAGPTPWYAKSVRSAFPPGTHLTVDAVPIVNGVAEVDLSSAVLAAGSASRVALAAQLVWSLKTLPEISAVRITVAGQPFLVPGASSVESADSWPQFDPSASGPDNSAVALVDGTVRGFSPSTASPTTALATSGSGTAPFAAISWDGATVAAAGAGGISLGPIGVKALRLINESVMARPSFDRFGGLWWVSLGRLRYLSDAAPLEPKIAGTQRPVTIAILGLAKVSLVSIAVARDGIRAAVIVQTASGNQLLFGRVSNNGGLLLDGLRRGIAIDLDVAATAWADADHVVVLGSVADGEPQAYLVDVAHGASQPLGAPSSPMSIAALSGQPILIGAADGLVYQSIGGAWTATGSGSNPTYPG